MTKKNFVVFEEGKKLKKLQFKKKMSSFATTKDSLIYEKTSKIKGGLESKDAVSVDPDEVNLFSANGDPNPGPNPTVEMKNLYEFVQGIYITAQTKFKFLKDKVRLHFVVGLVFEVNFLKLKWTFYDINATTKAKVIHAELKQPVFPFASYFDAGKVKLKDTQNVGILADLKALTNRIDISMEDLPVGTQTTVDGIEITPSSTSDATADGVAAVVAQKQKEEDEEKQKADALAKPLEFQDAVPYNEAAFLEKGTFYFGDIDENELMCPINPPDPISAYESTTVSPPVVELTKEQWNDKGTKVFVDHKIHNQIVQLMIKTTKFFPPNVAISTADGIKILQSVYVARDVQEQYELNCGEWQQYGQMVVPVFPLGQFKQESDTDTESQQLNIYNILNGRHMAISQPQFFTFLFNFEADESGKSTCLHKWAFLNNEKDGCASVKAALMSIYSLAHEDIQVFRDLLAENQKSNNKPAPAPVPAPVTVTPPPAQSNGSSSAPAVPPAVVPQAKVVAQSWRSTVTKVAKPFSVLRSTAGQKLF